MTKFCSPYLKYRIKLIKLEVVFFIILFILRFFKNDNYKKNIYAIKQI